MDCFGHLRYKPENDFIIDDSVVRDINLTHERIRNIAGKHESKDRARDLFRCLGGVAKGHYLKVLGLFAVIESLLNHAPAPKDQSDSITRQIKTKTALLEKRFDRPIDYSVFGASAERDPVWNKLYALRSRIAHCEHIDYSNALQLLQNVSIVESFLTEVVKSIIRLSLIEPEMVSDLQKC